MYPLSSISSGSFRGTLDSLMHRQLWRTLKSYPFQRGDRVLVVGSAGGGRIEESYPSYVTVTGVEFSPARLLKWKAEVADADDARRLQLVDPDELRLPFEEESFDAVVLSHVISGLPDGQKCLSEALRVLRDRGIILMVDHFRPASRPLAWIEGAVQPLCARFGWQSTVSLVKLLRRAYVSNADRLYLTEGSFFRTVYLQKLKRQVRLIAAPVREGELPSTRGPLVMVRPYRTAADVKQH
jgi:phosphatidylethanolamine/phosphatidyl-N-methylethanolamine N-methyltransferase